MLYRFSDNTSPRFDIVRPDMDIAVVDGKVQPGNGGVSVFRSLELCQLPTNAFVLERTASLSDDLAVTEDNGSHCLLAPSREMLFADYKRALAQLNSEATAVTGNPESVFTAPPLSQHPSRALRFVYEALVAVWRERIAVDGWDANDYAYIALLARDLDRGSLALEDLIWAPEIGWTKRGAFTAQAVRAFMAWCEEKAVGDESAEIDVANDNPYLEDVLCLDTSAFPDNPYAKREMQIQNTNAQ